MFLTALLVTSLASSAAGASQLKPASVEDVVAAAMTCLDATTSKGPEVSRLAAAGWVEALDSAGRPVTRGGHLFRKPNISAEIAAVGPVCSLVAPVASFDDVKATLSGVDDAVHPDRFKKVDRGILFQKGSHNLLFFVGSPSVKAPAAVRIDVTNMESH
ncbi:hypothetical protein HMF7854_13805 [Sphingomonas ginkgonis]|uniref:Uncharacterized protein n=1 Tax=Sphingomonas ginkgonis TaxID=2315330 RepID=A0A3R9Z7N0_9SPHN|nr:hypothetical protein [Sphingomonas ginkgonis]RST31789.1 hypothetical protein HMF7854_13805 [Sphingomonas ginkgonis]